MVGTAITVQPNTSAHLLYRNSVEKMTAQQVGALRQANAQSKQINDDRGFNFWAGLHGLPLPMYCQHHTELFLPWHRAYLYFFELSLQDQVRGVTLPWWDWTSPTSHEVGIPQAFAEETSDGGPNPLFSSPIPDIARVDPEDAALGTAPNTTFRMPGHPGALPKPQQIQAIIAAHDFLDFSQRI